MVVSDATFEKLRSRKQRRAVGSATLDVPDPLHLIALKLHALKNEARAERGHDLQDIIGLIRSCAIDIHGVEHSKECLSDTAMKKSEPRSTNSSTRTDWLHVDLPRVTDENAPRAHPAPPSSLVYAHAIELLQSVSDETWEQRRRSMNANRFVL